MARYSDTVWLSFRASRTWAHMDRRWKFLANVILVQMHEPPDACGNSPVPVEVGQMATGIERKSDPLFVQLESVRHAAISGGLA